MLLEKMAAWTIGIFLVLVAMLGIWMKSQPVDVAVSLQEVTSHNKRLSPLEDAIISLALDGETKCDTIKTMNELVYFRNIPHRYLDKEVHITFKCADFSSLDTIVKLQKHTKIYISRDASVYGNIQFRLWSERIGRFMGNVKMQIEDIPVMSDAMGEVILKVPLAKQRAEYKLRAAIPLVDSVLFMPYGKDCVIRTK